MSPFFFSQTALKLSSNNPSLKGTQLPARFAFGDDFKLWERMFMTGDDLVLPPKAFG
jgi:hypothetical protein